MNYRWIVKGGKLVLVSVTIHNLWVGGYHALPVHVHNDTYDSTPAIEIVAYTSSRGTIVGGGQNWLDLGDTGQ